MPSPKSPGPSKSSGRRTKRSVSSIQSEQPEPMNFDDQALGHRVRQLRQDHGWTLEQCSDTSGVSRSMLSQIERGQANPTLAVARRLAQALNTTLSELAGEQTSGAPIEIILAEDETYLFRSDEQCTIRTLSPLTLEKTVEFYEIRLARNGALRSAPHVQGTRECLHLRKGQIQLISSTNSCKLNQGDSAHYRADVHHAIENTGRSEAIGYLVVTYEKA